MRRFYGGFVDGKLDDRRIDDEFGGTNWRRAPAIFRNRREARAQYEDVREVEIREAPRKRRQSR